MSRGTGRRRWNRGAVVTAVAVVLGVASLAVAAGDADGMRLQLAQVKEHHGWIYEELARHPDVAALVNELALWGF